MRSRDARAKMKPYSDKKAYVKPNNLQVGDPELLKDTTIKQSATPFEPVFLTVVLRKGSMISAKRGNRVVTRNSGFFKQSHRHCAPAEEEDVSLTDTCPVKPDTHRQTDTPTFQHAHNSPIHHPQNTQTPVNPTPRRSTREKQQKTNKPSKNRTTNKQTNKQTTTTTTTTNKQTNNKPFQAT